MTIANDFTWKGVRVLIIHDEMNEHCNPREYDSLGIMVCWHPNYELGNERINPHEHHRMEEVVKTLIEERGAKVVLPLFLLDHSGSITIRAGDPILGDPYSETNQERLRSRGRFMSDEQGWDTSHIGFIFTNQERLDATCAPPEDAIKQLRAEVKEYDLWLRGEVYGYRVAPNTCWEESCWGFICDMGEADPYIEQEARSVAEAIAELIERESEAAAEWAARDIITEEGTTT